MLSSVLAKRYTVRLRNGAVAEDRTSMPIPDYQSLMLDFLYVQAKRWKDVVGSPEVMRFSGSLTKRHANRDVFITTSWFSPDAIEYVKEMPQRIILIDGRLLASLMIEHNVGVAPAKTYTLKRLDQDYCENL